MSKNREQLVNEITEQVVSVLNSLSTGKLEVIHRAKDSQDILNYIDNRSTDNSSKSSDGENRKESLVNKAIDALENKQYTEFKNLIQDLTAEDFYAVNEWGDSIMGNVISASDFSAAAIVNTHFNSYNAPDKKDINSLNTLSFSSVEGGICGTDFSQEDVCSILGNIFDQSTVVDAFYE